MNLSIKQQQRLNAERYYQAFKFSRSSSNSEETFRFGDLLVSTCTHSPMQTDSSSTLVPS
jgi:hypothetical protein